ncbi:MAG: phosphotransferase, partial [Betaproteobacteria bacterium]
GRYPSLRTEIEAVASALRKHAIATELKWPSVWQHGDFKLENLILDPATYSIVGVIDWELSCERGLPLLDLLYLIVYDRGVNEGLKLEDVYLMEILEWKFSARDNALLDEYLRTVGMTVTDAKIWAATYLIHDIGIRRFYSVSDPQHVSILKKMLSKTADALASPQSGAAAELRGAPAAGTST